MSALIANFAEIRERYSGTYEFTTTETPDPDYRKYLARKLAGHLPHVTMPHPADAVPLDISLDDVEGDVVAGISAVTVRGTLVIDMLWVDDPMRGQGIGRRLVQMAEEQARARGCTQARIGVLSGVAFYVGMGYAITGTMQQLTLDHSGPAQYTLCWLCKAL